MLRTEAERIAVLETLVPVMAEDIKETKDNVAILIEAHYKQKGAVKLAAIIWGGLIGIVGLVGWNKFGH